MAKADLKPVKDWLDSKERDYEAGLVLFAKFSRNRVLLARLSRKGKEWPSKLKYELNKILVINGGNPSAVSFLHDPDAKIEKTIPKGEEIDVAKWVIERGGNIVKPEQLPENLKKLWLDATDKYKKLRSLHEKMKLIGKDATDEQREPIAEEMRTLDDAIRANWDKIDAWDGKPAEPKQEKPKGDAKSDVKAVNAASTYISRNKAKLNDPKTKEKYLPKIQERVNTVIAGGVEIAAKTVTELTAHGVTFS